MLRFLGSTRTVEGGRGARVSGRRRTEVRPVLEPCESRQLLSGAGGHAVFAPTAERAAAAVRARFQGSLQGSVVNTPVSATVLQSDLTSSGRATRPIGPFTSRGEHILTATTPSRASRIVATCVGTGTIVTADGSEIDYRGTGTIKAGRVPGTFREDFRATVTGGTGQWEGASGTFRVQLNIQGNAVETPNPFSGRFNGVIARSRA